MDEAGRCEAGDSVGAAAVPQWQRRSSELWGLASGPTAAWSIGGCEGEVYRPEKALWRHSPWLHGQ
jgi:hypothetical protein